MVELLLKLAGREYKHYSVRHYLLDALRERNMPPSRDNMRDLANELRNLNSPSFIVEELLHLAMKSETNAVIESIRTIGEVSSLRSICGPEFTLVAIDADRQTRYERICSRASETDSVTFEQWVKQEEMEMYGSDPSKQNLQACIELADVRLDNSETFDKLEYQVQCMLSQL